MKFQLEGTLTEQDNHRHISHPVSVPEGATRLDINFQYDPKREARYPNLLTLSVFDPQRERGTGHRGQPTQHVTISPAEATPGYLPGPLSPGTWDVMVNTNLINPGPAVNYRFDIAIGFDPQPPPSVLPSPGTTHPRGPGWYRGDLHGHSLHSDGSWDVPGLVEFARQRQLDFVSLTDHNTLSALAQMDSLSSDDLLTMGGIELTTFYGHALALGIRQSIDWRVQSGQRTMNDILAEIENSGGLFVIAHPACPGDPVCTGCHWDYEEVMPGTASVVEVWNDHWTSMSNNQEAVQLWYEWLNRGHRLVATAGTDIHGPPDPAREFGFNVVYAEALAENAILDAVRKGHLYMSSGPHLDFSGVSSSGQTAMTGETLTGQGHEITASWDSCRPDDHIRLILGGKVYEQLAAGVQGKKTWRLEKGHEGWCVVEIRASQGDMRALTNPIFIT